MVASANRMFSTSGGRVITLQDAAKAGLIDVGDIPLDMEDRAAFKDRLLDTINGDKQKALIEAAQSRVGYDFNTKKITPVKTERTTTDKPQATTGVSPKMLAKMRAEREKSPSAGLTKT